MYYKTAPIPSPSQTVFTGGIDHPDLWLWDSWTMKEPDGGLHLYCLALSKTHSDGRAITPPERNDFTFHVRRFTSTTAGRTWWDQGPVLQPGQVADGADSRNVWSGSTLRLDGETVAFGFTGIRDCGPGQSFLQTICVATGAGPAHVDQWPEAALSCPVRDYDMITAKGYHLGRRETLGSNEGETGGGIMAWRDPFLFIGPGGQLNAVWSAELSPAGPAIAHGKIEREGSQFRLTELSAPIKLPDAHLMTQAEVPKVYHDPASGDWLLLVSATDRRYERQPVGEVTHVHRLYRSADLHGPWAPFDNRTSALPGLEGLFGASLAAHDASSGRFSVLGPYTENAGPEKQLRFAEIVDIRTETGAPRQQPSLA